MNIESKLDIGDSVIFYGSITHGVEPVDKKEIKLEVLQRKMVCRNVC